MAKQIPEKIVGGDTFKVAYNASPYTAADGYYLEFHLTGPSGSPLKSTVTANTTDSSGAFELRIGPEQTANLIAGLYSYAVVATDGTDQYSIESGTTTVELRADLTAASDLRSHAQKVYDAICAVIEGRATSDVASYTIAGRTLTKIPLKELLALKDHYKELVAAEQGSKQKKMYVRFS